MSVAKSMVMRGLVIYFIMSFFRKTPAPTTTGPAGVPQTVANPAINIFDNGTLMVKFLIINNYYFY